MWRDPGLARLRVAEAERDAARRQRRYGDLLPPVRVRGAVLRRPAARLVRLAARAAFALASVLDGSTTATHRA